MIEIEELDQGALDRWLGVSNAVRPRDPLTPSMMIDWSSQAESMIWLVATADGVDTATGHGIIGWHADPGVARLEVSVLAPWERHGLGTAVLERLSAWALAGGQSLADGTVDEDDAGSLAWAGRRGFTEVGRDVLLRLDLDGFDRPEADPPEGITITSWADRPDTIGGIYEVACEAYPDIPGRESAAMAPFEKWRDNDLAGASDRPDATFVATAGSEVVGYAKLSLSEALPDTVFHDITGVKRAWRGRGIAGALKRTEIAWAIDGGYAMLKTANEERNAPIRVLNERYGYVVEPGTIRVRGPLTAGS
ncbi:MAG: GNAT family N-acetyltransferase [Thermoleophilia bacterium]|nr:GNAT family N-acetyltransferase [Thermoleophilia bacterium]